MEQIKRNSQKCGFFSFLGFTPIFIFSNFEYKNKKTMKSILIKESDRLFSKIHKNKYVSVYLIYLIENDVRLECYSELGVENKAMRVDRKSVV